MISYSVERRILPISRNQVWAVVRHGTRGGRRTVAVYVSESIAHTAREVLQGLKESEL